MRLETLFEEHRREMHDYIQEQRAANREARESRHEAANRHQAMSNQLSRLDLIVCGDGHEDKGMRGDVQELMSFFTKVKGGWWVVAIGATVVSAIGAAGAWALSFFGIHIKV